MERQTTTAPQLRVLCVPELLDMIFSFLDDKDNITNACVSKAWSSIALDKVWRHVEDTNRLFSLLAPLEPMSPGTYPGPKTRFHFSTPPTTTGWMIFLKYARRVRSLTYDDFMSTEGHLCTLDASVFDTIARTRTTLDILPNNKTLSWKSDPQLLQYTVLFLHPNLREMTITLLPPRVSVPAEPPMELYQPIFLDLLARSPNILLLDVRSLVPSQVIMPILVECLPSLRKLRKLVVPQYYITSSVVQAVSALEDLDCIEFQYQPPQSVLQVANVRPFDPNCEEGAFPSLSDISLTAGFEDVARFLEQKHSPRKLTMLFVESFQIENPPDFEFLLTAVVDRCPLMEQLCILSEVDASDVVPAPSPEDALTYAHIQGVLAMPALRHLELHHQYPLSITHAEICDLAQKVSSRIEVLILNCEPAYIASSSLTLQALLPFAEHCPKLQHLALFMNASAADIPIPPPNDPFPTFQSLTRFWAGTSLIAEEGPVALFLSLLLPLSCTIDSGITWSQDETERRSRVIERGTWDTIRARCKKWCKVQEMVPLLVRLRMEERERGGRVRREVEDLRMRTDVLMAERVVKGGDGCVLQ